jgi:hypothetical protein
MPVVTVDFQFVEHRKSHVVRRRAELFDFRVGAGFLPAELVAGKTAYDQALALVFLVQRFQRRAYCGV